jgi:hypothetical protein
MGLETLLFIFLFVIVISVAVGVAKARRRMANRVKPPMEHQPESTPRQS